MDISIQLRIYKEQKVILQDALIVYVDYLKRQLEKSNNNKRIASVLSETEEMLEQLTIV